MIIRKDFTPVNPLTIAAQWVDDCEDDILFRKEAYFFTRIEGIIRYYKCMAAVTFEKQAGRLYGVNGVLVDNCQLEEIDEEEFRLHENDYNGIIMATGKAFNRFWMYDTERCPAPPQLILSAGLPEAGTYTENAFYKVVAALANQPGYEH